MSESTSTTVVTQVAAPVTVDAAKPSASSASTAPPAPGEANEKPHWLAARLEQKEKALLKELGVESLDDAKKAIADLNAKREAEKTAAQKASEAETALKAEKAKSEEMAKALGAYAKSKMDGLTEAQRAAVVAVAGEDAAKQLATIEALTPTWASQPAPTAAPATAGAAPIQQQKPADTAPAPSAPNEGGAPLPADPKAIYADLKKTNPVIAARYAFANGLHG